MSDNKILKGTPKRCPFCKRFWKYARGEEYTGKEIRGLKCSETEGYCPLGRVKIKFTPKDLDNFFGEDQSKESYNSEDMKEYLLSLYDLEEGELDKRS